MVGQTEVWVAVAMEEAVAARAAAAMDWVATVGVVMVVVEMVVVMAVATAVVVRVAARAAARAAAARVRG